MEWYQKQEYSKDIFFITRNDILKYTILTSQKTKTIETYKDLLVKKYPVIKESKEIYDSFYDALMDSDENKLGTFILKYKESILNGFIEDIEKDIAPIKNAIFLPYSSGFVESNNKFKRILYRRSKIVNLFRKCYVPFLINHTDFQSL